MGQNFDDYSGFQSKITPPKHLAPSVHAVGSKSLEISYILFELPYDQGPKNGTLGNELGITTEITYFLHPLHPTKRIYWIQDIIHLIKLLRYVKVKVFSKPL